MRPELANHEMLEKLLKKFVDFPLVKNSFVNFVSRANNTSWEGAASTPNLR
jgi:hypothetical protein